MGSTDDLNAIKPWTTGSHEMASGGAITPQGHTTGDRLDIEPDEGADATGQPAEGR